MYGDTHVGNKTLVPSNLFKLWCWEAIHLFDVHVCVPSMLVGQTMGISTSMIKQVLLAHCHTETFAFLDQSPVEYHIVQAKQKIFQDIA